MNECLQIATLSKRSQNAFSSCWTWLCVWGSVTVSHYTAAVTSLLLRLGRRPWELMATVVVAYVSGSVFYDSCISCSDFIWSRLDMSPDKWPVRPLGMFCWLRFLSLRKGILRSSIFPLAIWSWNWSILQSLGFQMHRGELETWYKRKKVERATQNVCWKLGEYFAWKFCLTCCCPSFWVTLQGVPAQARAPMSMGGAPFKGSGSYLRSLAVKRKQMQKFLWQHITYHISYHDTLAPVPETGILQSPQKCI